MKVSATFPKSKRLLKHADFERVYREGKRQVSRNMSVFFLLPQANDDGAVRVGITAQPQRVQPRDASGTPDGSVGVRIGITVGRALGNAVSRNRIKRRMREAVRRHLSELTGAVDVVINPRKSAADIELAELEKEVEQAFRKIERAPRGLIQISGAAQGGKQ